MWEGPETFSRDLGLKMRGNISVLAGVCKVLQNRKLLATRRNRRGSMRRLTNTTISPQLERAITPNPRNAEMFGGRTLQLGKGNETYNS